MVLLPATGNRRTRVVFRLKLCQAVRQTRNLGVIHLRLPKMWDNTWYFIEYGINEKLEVELQRKYKTVDR